MEISDVARWTTTILALLPIAGFIVAGCRGRRPAASLGFGAGMFTAISAALWIASVPGAGTHAFFRQEWAFLVLIPLGIAAMYAGLVFTREMSTETMIVDEDDGTKRVERTGPVPFVLQTLIVVLAAGALIVLGSSELVVFLRNVTLP